MSPDTETGIHLAVVSPLPPSRLTLSEYGLHLVRALAAHPDVARVTVLTDVLDDGIAPAPAPGVDLVPVWRFGDVRSTPRIVRALRSLRPDAVLWNLQFASFGSTPVAGGLGLLGPLTNRLVNRGRNQVLLHNLADEVDLSEAGLSRGPAVDRVVRAGTRFLTRALLSSGQVSVTMPDYVDVLERNYGATSACWIPHGTFDAVASPIPEPAGPHRVLTFGKFGTYKRIEPLVEACRRLRDEGRDVTLVVAGTDSPNAAGYLERVRSSLPTDDAVEFTGYVPEDEVLATFADSHVVVFPYTSTTGSSGVLHQAASVGRAVALPAVGDLERLLTDEGYDASTFEPGNAESIASTLAALLDDDDARRRAGDRNHRAAHACGMPDVADWHLLHIRAAVSSRPRAA